MKTLTHNSPVSSKSLSLDIPSLITQAVNQKGFYLYHWLTPTELRLSLERDYLQVIRYASIPLAIITFLSGAFGFMAGPLGTLIAVLGVLAVFYTIVMLYLASKMLYRSYIYTNNADIVVTDHHFIARGKPYLQSDAYAIGSDFDSVGRIFHEPFLGKSRLDESRDIQKSALWKNIKTITSFSEKILTSTSRSREGFGAIVLIMMIAGGLYAFMMGFVYFFGLFFVNALGWFFSIFLSWYQRFINKNEYIIQYLFSEIDTASAVIHQKKDTLIKNLAKARTHDWTGNILEEINTGNEEIVKKVEFSIQNAKKLQELLHSSAYHDVFNFSKYHHWLRQQIIEPLESIQLLLIGNIDRMTEAKETIKEQISRSLDSSHQAILYSQEKRLDMQLESFHRIVGKIQSYLSILNQTEKSS